jgi:hypothetical protein
MQGFSNLNHLLPRIAGITFRVRAALEVGVFVNEVLNEHIELLPPFRFFVWWEILVTKTIEARMPLVGTMLSKW